MDLPLDCEAWYYSDFLSPAQSEGLIKAVCESVDVSDAVVKMADGREVSLDYGIFVFADASIVESPLAEPWGHRQHWIPEVRDVKEKVESAAKRIYDVCVGYYYRNGNSGFDYHYDIPAFVDISTLACISLGQERVFSFRRVDDHDETYDLNLADGSLLIMGEHCRERYEHALPVGPDAKQPRMVLVFQNFGRNRES